MIRALGLVPAGGNFEHVRRRIADLGLDTSHMTGRGWNVGLTFRPSHHLPLVQLLVAGRWTPTHRLKLRLFREGLKEPRCELCGWAQRATDGRLPLELDHTNGDRDDNRIENLRILCPNCHALQPTHRGLNRRRRRR
ncbi:MAG: HNH endonuclease [Myxococcales bacterium]|nr:HNH endonuclease [Myxococcales bacterium]